MSYPKSMIVDAGDLRPSPWNTNIMTPENEAKLEASIKRFGFFRPVVVRETDSGLEIIGGEHRWEVARKIGIKVPIMNLGPISDREAKEISITDNARYGVDDTIGYAEFLQQMGNVEDLSQFLPYSDADFADIFSSLDIALDDLDLQENFDQEDEKPPAPEPPKPPKTHTIMRFKIGLADAERITALIAEIQRDHSFTGSDELTNAGDALVHLLFDARAGEGAFELAEVPAGEVE